MTTRVKLNNSNWRFMYAIISEKTFKARSKPMTDIIPTNQEMQILSGIASAAKASQFYGKKGGKEGILMILLTARELGLPPMFAINGGINLIKGVPELSARAMSALIRRAGHKIRICSLDFDCCELEGERADTGEKMRVSFHITEARRMGIVKKDGAWETVPSDMLFARAVTRLARRLFSDCIGMAYVEGEIPRDDPDDDKNDEKKDDPVPQITNQDLEPISEEEAKHLSGLIADPERESKILEYFCKKTIQDLSRPDYEAVIKKIKKEKETQDEGI